MLKTDESSTNLTDKVDVTKDKTIKGAVSYGSNFFALSYGIIFSISMSYNIGYFKFIDPQIVDLMTLSDYINDTIHNIWLFLIATVTFLGGYLAIVRKITYSKIEQLWVYTFFTILVSICIFLKNLNLSKFWPTIKAIVVLPELLPLFVILLCSIFFVFAYLVFKFVHNLIYKKITIFFVGFFPICIFLFLVLVPYLGGTIESYIQTNYLTSKDYQDYIVTIQLKTSSNLENAYIIKILDKGLIVRQFNQKIKNDKGKFVFFHSNDIVKITYRNNITK